MSRLSAAFGAARGRTGLIPFLTTGYPSPEATVEMAREFSRRGALALELGIPFSDPIADGPEIQRASEWALRHGVTPETTLGVVRELRRESQLPLVIMTYANPILCGGIDAFARAAREAGVDGVIVSDVPPEEMPELWQAFDRAAIDTVMLLAPTTPEARWPAVIGRSRGFLYCLARTGVTGRAPGEALDLAGRLRALRARSQLPLAVGFGISSTADAAVVGAAFMRAITEDPERGAAARALERGDRLIEALA